MHHESLGGPWLFPGFIVFVLALLALDLGVLRRGAREISVRQALAWSAGWIGLALAFAGLLYARFGARPALEFLTGYVIEKALSVDNLFVILLILTSFAVPRALFHKVLSLGILGAIVMRGALIIAGAALVEHVHAVTYVFGAILAFTAIKLLRERESEPAPVERHPAVRFIRRFFPVVNTFSGDRFLVKDGARRAATPLLLALVTVEVSDLVFATDSIPAIFAVTTDPFIVFTSNIFAVLGLRSLFFALEGLLSRFHHLKVGLALVLLFVGAKMLLAKVLVVPVGVSLAAIALILSGAVIASSLHRKEVSQ